jgi:hypothetical protein
MFSRKTLLAAVATAAVLTLISISAAQKAARMKDQRLVSKSDLRQQQKEQARADATVIKDGVKDARQKEHAKRYKGYKSGKKLRDLTAATGDVMLRREVGTQGGDPNEAPFDFQKFLREMADEADAVVVGTVKNKSSQLTEDEDYVFTDYDLTAVEVLKDNAAAPIEPNKGIVVTRPGGTILLDGRIVEALDESFQPLRKNDQYLLFLRFIPSTGAYEALNSKAGFRIGADKINKLTKEPLAFDDANVAAFINEVRAAVASAPAGKRKGGVK